MSWAGVTPRFKAFHQNVNLTSAEIGDGLLKSQNITSALNASFYGHRNSDANSLWVGSWGKGTAAHPPRDLDMFFRIPDEMWQSISQRSGNTQSQLLQEVRNVLKATYSQSDIRGDGQVVVVSFNTLTVEVIPYFLVSDGTCLICDTHDGGSWVIAKPTLEIQAISSGDQLTNGNLRPIVKMLKIWKRENNVPIKSYILETLATEFMLRSEWRNNGYFYYDWLFRDFFPFMLVRVNTLLMVPDGQNVFLTDEWKSKVETAKDRAALACVLEQNNYIPEAGEEWQKIFGAQVPRLVTPDPVLL